MDNLEKFRREKSELYKAAEKGIEGTDKLTPLFERMQAAKEASSKTGKQDLNMSLHPKFRDR